MGVSVFITATDTDAGKTFVTASLARALAETELKVCALKPVCCGRTAGQTNPDIKTLLHAQGMPDTQTDTINLYDFTEFAAPGQAAAKEGRRIEPEKLVQWCSARMQEYDITLIEGVGGLMVPLAENFLVSDWLAAMPDCVVVLVVRTRLGGINHALLTLNQLHHMGREPAWVVLNDADGSGHAMLTRHAEAMSPFLPPHTQQLLLSHIPEVDYAPLQSLTTLVGNIQIRARERYARSDC
ncbi:MAG: dethiobiotin synthase [Mariprofundaceae bacterium]|nr:dethiobiotin synthase [Mariprofundaceae bacterium]